MQHSAITISKPNDKNYCRV